MIKNIKAHNILNIIEISKSMDLMNYSLKYLWNYLIKYFLWFFKVWRVK
jgi:hypothetical protein